MKVHVRWAWTIRACFASGLLGGNQSAISIEWFRLYFYMVPILVWSFIILVLISVIFYYRKKKNASILKTFLMACASLVAIFIFLIVFVLIFDISGETQTSAEDELYSCVDENEFGSWSIGEYINEFKESTGEKYVFQESTNGSFSNSATTNSDLIARILIDKDDIRIRLKEYGSRYAKDEEYISFQVKRNNEIVSLDKYNYIDNQGYIEISKDDAVILKTLLFKGGEVKFYGVVDEGRSTYNFSFIGDKLKDALIKIDAFNEQ